MYSSEVKKTEILMENFRRAIGLRIKESKEVYEGEVSKSIHVCFRNCDDEVGVFFLGDRNDSGRDGKSSGWVWSDHQPCHHRYVRIHFSSFSV